MAATRTSRKRGTARKPAQPRRTQPTATPDSVAPVGATETETTPAPEMPFTVVDARDRAADIVDAAREQAAALQSEAESAAARTVADTQEQATALMIEAVRDAGSVRTSADEEATARRAAAADDLAAARGEADRLLADARERAEQLLAGARAQVTELTELVAADREATAAAVGELRRLAQDDLTAISALVDQRRGEAGSILARAQEQADLLLAAARTEVEQARARHAALAATAAEQYDGRRAEAEALYADAVRAADERRRAADQDVAAAQAEAERARAALRAELRELGEKFDTEAAAKRAGLDAELAGLKQACEQQRERLRTEARTTVVQLRDTAQKEADRVLAEAERKAKAVTDRAAADESRARRLLEEAREAKKAASRRHGWQQNLSSKAWKTAPWIALAAGVGLAASGEYELARMVGIHPYVAPLLPVSIDVYCVTAFRAKQDIPAALALMASANVIFHLSEQAHLVPEGGSAPWWLTTFVVLIFVAVIWRVHTLMHTDGTDSHGDTAAPGIRTGTGGGNGTPDRTGTHRRHGGPDGTPSGRTGTPGHDLYATAEPVRQDTGGSGRGGTHLEGPAPHPQHTSGPGGPVSRAYSDRTGGVHTIPAGAARTGTQAPARTGSARPAAQGRTGTVTARAPLGPDGVPGARTGTGTTSSPATGTTGTVGTAGAERTGTPVRTDEELLPFVQELPRDREGFVTLYQARTKLGVNQPRAVRLLARAGLLRPEDADKHLA